MPKLTKTNVRPLALRALSLKLISQILKMTDGNMADIQGYDQVSDETKAVACNIFPDMKP